MSTILAHDADEWRDVASRSFVPLAFQRADPGFAATLDRREVADGVTLSSIRSDALVIERTRRLAASAESDDIHISLQVASRGRLVQGDRVTAIGPGVLTVAETHRPFLLDYDAPGQRHIVMQASRRTLGVRDDLLRRAGGRAIEGPNPVRDAYVAFATGHVALAQDALGDEDGSVARILCELAGAMLRAAFGADDVRPLSEEAAFAEIAAFVRGHLASTLLTPERLAAAHFMSRRRLYSVFERAGTTPSAFIRAERVARARQLLRDPRFAATTITDLAFAVGFADATTFTRAFRRETGCAPQEWRGARG